ncbi:MAG: hypothetical protein ACRDGJ_03965 [Candidatus Limnocylindria bacterium]
MASPQPTESRSRPDLLSVALVVFFVALAATVAALLLLPVLY